MLFKQTVFIFLVFLKGTLSITTVDLICSGKINYMNTTDRDINYISNLYRCDSAIVKGYYTFGPDSILPNFCPRVDSCASDAPFWTNDEQPNEISPGPVSLKLCNSIQLGANGQNCYYGCNVNVTAVYCSNLKSIVYEFFSVPICNARFCYLKQTPCGINESSSTGFQPCTSLFPFDKLYNSTKRTTYGIAETDERFKNINGTSLLCSIKCPDGLDCSQLSGDVLWLIKSSSFPIGKTTLFYDSVKNELYSYILESSWTRYINNYFYCSITPIFNNNRPYEPIKTPFYYAGFVLQLNDTFGLTEFRYIDTNEITLKLEEANSSNALLTVYSELPIMCNKIYSYCGVKIQMAAETIFKEYDSIRLKNCVPPWDCGACAKTIRNQTVPDPENSASFQIIATIEEKNLRTSDRMRLSLKTKYHESLASDFFDDLLLPIIIIDFVPKNAKIVQSYSLNDPHLLTHDGTPIEFHGRENEYLVLENENALLRIHSITKSCRSLGLANVGDLYCNFGIYIQSIDDLIFFEKTSPDTLFYKDLSSPKIKTVKLVFDVKTGYALLPKETSIKATIEGGFFIVSTHFATRIKIDRKDGNYYINPSKYDLDSVYGLLGNYNNDSLDDLIDTKCGKVKTLEDYFDCYKITKPLLAMNQYYPVTNVSDLNQYCMCVNSINTTIVCPLGLRLEENKKYKLITNKQKFISMNVLEDIYEKSKIFESYKNYQNELLNQKRSIRSTTSSCVSTLNITIFQECSKQNLIDLPTLIELCELDFNATNLNIWSETYYDFAMNSCKEKLSSDKNNFVETSFGVNVPQIELLEELCTDNCNYNGNCSLGVCNCFYPFDGYDCSIDTSIPLQIYNTSAINNICSLNSTSSCFDVLILVNRITPKLIVNYDAFYKTINGTIQLLEKKSSNSYVLSDNIIYIQLNNNISKIINGLSIFYFNITIKDNSISNTITYTIINDDCHQCSNSINCSIKPGKCDIDFMCYDVNETNPINQLQICNPSYSFLIWSNIESNMTSSLSSSTIATSSTTTSNSTTTSSTTSTSDSTITSSSTSTSDSTITSNSSTTSSSTSTSDSTITSNSTTTSSSTSTSDSIITTNSTTTSSSTTTSVASTTRNNSSRIFLNIHNIIYIFLFFMIFYQL